MKAYEARELADAFEVNKRKKLIEHLILNIARAATNGLHQIVVARVDSERCMGLTEQGYQLRHTDDTTIISW